jgi:uncharacterized protein (TIGR00251 family)
MPEFSSIEFQTGGPGTVFGLRVNPGADENGVDGPYGDRLKLSICEPATDGKANTELTSFLATVFRCSSRHIEIISGQSSRDKRVRVHGRTPKEIRALLNKQVQT